MSGADDQRVRHCEAQSLRSDQIEGEIELSGNSPILHRSTAAGIKCLALAGHSREDTDHFRNVFCLRHPIER